MARTVEALVEPKVLVWARESAGYSVADAAHKATVKEENLAAWERGSAKPSFSQLRKLANVYKRPLAVFYLSEPPRDFQPLADHRRFSRAGPKPISPELRVRIRDAQNLRESAIELAEYLGDQPPRVPAIQMAALNNAEDVGKTAREILGVSTLQQSAWNNEYDALRGWTKAIEAQGVLVTQASGVDIGELRGLSITFETFPVIVVNSKDSPRARVFSLHHEFIHILLRRGGLCDFHEGSAAELEAFCNASAAAALMPKDEFLADFAVRDAPRGQAPWDSATVQAIGRRFTVSEEAALRRLLTLGKTTRAFYEERRAELAALTRETTEGGPEYHVRRLAELGSVYVGLALQAYDRGSINLNDLSDYLGVKVRHIEPMRGALRGRLE